MLLQREAPMQRQINYRTMRQVVGGIAVLLAPAVSFFDAGPALDSISASYWGDARDVFVGALFAVGFFLVAYNGSGEGKDRSFWASKAAAAAALCVALFPTGPRTVEDVPPEWTTVLTGWFSLRPVHVHYAAAIGLFLCLACLLFTFADRAREKGSSRRALGYRGIAVSMLLGMGVLTGVGQWGEWNTWLYWVEVWGLIHFGGGWLWAGTYKSEEAVTP